MNRKKKDVRARANACVSLAEKKSEDLSHKIEPLPGAIVEQRVRCGKRNCKCAKGKLHGPYFVRFWYENGERRRKYVKKRDFEAVSVACAEYKRLQNAPKKLIRTGNEIYRLMKQLLREYQI